MFRALYIYIEGASIGARTFDYGDQIEFVHKFNSNSLY